MTPERLSKKFPNEPAASKPYHAHPSPRTPLLWLPKHQPQPLKHPPLRDSPIRAARSLVRPPLQIHPSARAPLAHAAAVKLPALDLLGVAPQIALEGGARGPAGDGAADGTPGGHDDVDAAVGVGVLARRRWGGGLRGPSGVLPDDKGFIEGVEAVASGAVQGTEGKRLLVAIRVRQGQGENVSDAAACFKSGDDVGDEVERHALRRVAENQVDIAGFRFSAAVATDDDGFQA